MSAEENKPIPIPFSVVLHYNPQLGSVQVIPIGVNMSVQTFLQVLDAARTEAIRVELAQQMADAKASKGEKQE